jgi:mono/diheme cytochrome c family protein
MSPAPAPLSLARVVALAATLTPAALAGCAGAARDPDVVVGPSATASAAGPLALATSPPLAARLDEAAIERGARLFGQRCAPCHGERGAGLIGPNLTDDAFLHGSELESVRRVVAAGVPQKGMPGWEPALGKESVLDLATFVVSLAGSDLPGKAPQGERRAPSSPRGAP